MRIARIVTFAIALSVTSAAVAQGTAPQPPASTPPAGMTRGASGGMDKMDKKAISKECSIQADQQKLKGKPRKAFRNKCKRMGGKAA